MRSIYCIRPKLSDKIMMKVPQTPVDLSIAVESHQLVLVFGRRYSDQACGRFAVGRQVNPRSGSHANIIRGAFGNLPGHALLHRQSDRPLPSAKPCSTLANLPQIMFGKSCSARPRLPMLPCSAVPISNGKNSFCCSYKVPLCPARLSTPPLLPTYPYSPQ